MRDLTVWLWAVTDSQSISTKRLCGEPTGAEDKRGAVGTEAHASSHPVRGRAGPGGSRACDLILKGFQLRGCRIKGQGETMLLEAPR